MQTAGSQTPSPTTAAEVLGAPPSNGTTSFSPQTPNDPSPSGGAPKSTDPAAPQPEKVSPKLQVLIQRERQAVERERAAKAKEAELTQREERLKAFESAKSNPREALKLLGLSYQDLTKAELADGELPPEVHVKRLEEKVDGIEKTRQQERENQELESRRREERQHNATITKFKGDIDSYLKENANRYELIEFEQSQELVYGVIDENYNRTLKAEIEKAAGLEVTESLEAAQQLAADAEVDISDLRGEVLTIAQAADKVELHLEQKYSKARDLTKVKGLLAPRPANPKPPAEKPKTPPSQTPKTLTNAMSAGPTPQRRAPISDDERVAKAIAYAKSLRPAA